MTEGEGSPGGRAIILVVEPDPHVRELEAYFLEEAGYAVEFTPTGRRRWSGRSGCAPTS